MIRTIVRLYVQGKKRREQAAIGVEKMKEHVDSLIVINNDKLIEIHGRLGFKTGVMPPLAEMANTLLELMHEVFKGIIATVSGANAAL